MTQKGDQHIKLFSTSSEVRMLSSILSQLNILCTSLLIQYCTKSNNSPVIHHSHVMATLPVLHRSGAIHMSKLSVLHQE